MERKKRSIDPTTLYEYLLVFRNYAAAELFDFRQETQAVELANDRQEMNASVIVQIPDVLPFLFLTRNDAQTPIYTRTISSKHCR